MIFRPHGGTALVDRAVLTMSYPRSLRTIRDRCTPTACDVRTRALLYNAEECERAMSVDKRRATHRAVA